MPHGSTFPPPGVCLQRTLDLVRTVRFDNLNTYAYSLRPKAEAALWEDQVRGWVGSLPGQRPPPPRGKGFSVETGDHRYHGSVKALRKLIVTF